MTEIANNIVIPVLFLYSTLCSSMWKEVEILKEERVNVVIRYVLLIDCTMGIKLDTETFIERILNSQSLNLNEKFPSNNKYAVKF